MAVGYGYGAFLHRLVGCRWDEEMNGVSDEDTQEGLEDRKYRKWLKMNDRGLMEKVCIVV